MGLFPSSKFCKFSESIKWIAWRHRVTHTQHRAAAPAAEPAHGQLCSEHHSSGREHTELKHSMHNRSSLERMNAVPLVSARNTAPQEQGVLWNHSICCPESRLAEERAGCSLNSGLTSANNTVAPLSIYTAIKAMGLYSTYPTPMKYLLIRKALSIPGISLLSLLRCQKTIHAVKEKTSVGKNDHFRYWLIALSGYRSTLNKDYDASIHWINLGNYLDKNTWCRYLSQVMLHSLLVLQLSRCSEV